MKRLRDVTVAVILILCPTYAVSPYADGAPIEKVQHKEPTKNGPGGLRGWVWAAQKYKGDWVNEHIHVERDGKVIVEAKSEKPFIEDWEFSPKGVVTKSRALHGPATLELFSLEDGHRIASIDAFADDLPNWAKKFGEN